MILLVLYGPRGTEARRVGPVDILLTRSDTPLLVMWVGNQTLGEHFHGFLTFGGIPSQNMGTTYYHTVNPPNTPQTTHSPLHLDGKPLKVPRSPLT